MALKVQHWVPPVTASTPPLADAWRLIPGASCTTSVCLGGKLLPLPMSQGMREHTGTGGQDENGTGEGEGPVRPGKTARLREAGSSSPSPGSDIHARQVHPPLSLEQAMPWPHWVPPQHSRGLRRQR